MLRSKKKTVPYIKNKEGIITAITSYDYQTTKIVSEAGVDIILVGDSLGMVLQGKKDTLGVTVDQIVYHTKLVSMAEPDPLIVSDMPFGSYHTGVGKSIENAVKMVKEGGAEAVKLEGGKNRADVIRGIIGCDIPVLGHLGLTPQSVNATGGFKVQGKNKKKADEIFEDALILEDLGVFALVLESIPVELGKRITEALTIPTIGIGAGNFCNGQILVFHDLVGFTDLYLPKFVRKYADVRNIMLNAVKNYVKDVETGNFPGDDESYFLIKKS